MPASSTPLLRYATVRAAQRAQRSTSAASVEPFHSTWVRFIRYGDAKRVTPWHGTLRQLLSDQTGSAFIQAAKQQATALVGSNTFVLRGRPVWCLILERERARLHQLNTLPEAGSIVSADVNAIRNEPTFESFRAQVWDSLYAVLISGSRDAAVVERLVAVLRMTTLLEDVAAANAPATIADLKRTLLSRPLLPSDIFPLGQHLSARTEDEDVSIAVELPPTVSIAPLDRTRELHSALDSVDRAELPLLALLLDEETLANPPAGPLDLTATRLHALGLAAVQSRLLSREGVDILGQTLPTAKASIKRLIRQRLSELPARPASRPAHRMGNSLVEIRSGAVFSPVTGAPVLRSAVRPLGVMDLRIVRQQLDHYRPAEIAHVENVLRSEFRERRHRWMRRTEESETVETDRTEEREHDLQSTERSEMEKESSATIDDRESMQAGVTVTADFGQVKVAANAGYARATARQESTRIASKYAKEVVDRTVERIVERVRKQRTFALTQEIEENNTHQFANGVEADISGVYRWLEKVYLMQVVNYGRRLMFEFTVPEPAAFYRETLRRLPIPGITVEVPEDISDLSPEAIRDYNYHLYVQRFQLDGVEPPPTEYLVVSKSFGANVSTRTSDPGGGGSPGGGSSGVIDFAKDDLSVPGGYKAIAAQVRVTALHTTDTGHNLIVKGTVGSMRLDFSDSDTAKYSIDVSGKLSEETNLVSVCLSSLDYEAIAAAVIVTCKVKPEEVSRWQLGVYEQIVQRHAELKRRYDEQLLTTTARAQPSITGKNPAFNRATERVELKKSCITMLSNQAYDSFNAMSASSSGYREINILEAISEGKLIRFFEEAFEWDNMTYVFYPYFWANKAGWNETALIDDQDRTFSNFLSAGAAKVMVPVKPGDEASVLYYLRTGEVWLCEGQPTIDDTEDVSMLDDVASGEQLERNPLEEGEPWDVIVPTSLVMLQQPAWNSPIRDDG
jgi:hypothetical protein